MMEYFSTTHGRMRIYRDLLRLHVVVTMCLLELMFLGGAAMVEAGLILIRLATA